MKSWIKKRLGSFRARRDARKAIVEAAEASLPGDISDLRRKAAAFSVTLSATKRKLEPEPFWYPYSTFGNLDHLSRLLTGRHRQLLDLIGGRAVMDIGAADGDLSYFLESLGVRVHLVDNAPTNYNALRGARLLKEALRSSVEIHEIDLDSCFRLPEGDFGLIFFLGTLYHLKNPFHALEHLATRTEYCLISTRIARFLADRKTWIADGALAYLLDERECNDDPTNFWIFTEKGFRRILARTGWEVLDFLTVGNTTRSDPASSAGDERAFCLVKSRRVTHARGV